VEFAREAGLTLHARSTHAAGTGTQVSAAAAVPSGGGRVRGVTCDLEVWALSAPLPLEPLLEVLDAHRVRARHVIEDHGHGLVIIPLQDVHGPEGLRARLPSGVAVAEDRATVTCVGAGLNSDFGVVRQVQAVAHGLGAPVTALYTSALQVTVVTSRDSARALTAALHGALLG
jgi:aspartate kinase